MAEEKLKFETEVSRLLGIVANSLYSRKEIFLRELISNASDACDRLRYELLTAPELVADAPEFRVRISVDKRKRIVEIDDNGIGMNREALISDLGTIARSGTSAYIEQLGDKADLNAIGQFGVGFYSAFMVASEVEVISRRAGEGQAWRWVSDGTGEFAIGEGERDVHGATVRLKLRKGEDEFLDASRLRHVARTYSNHIALPIVVVDEDGKEETVNEASALWTRPRKEITEDQYREFFHHVGGFGDPWMTIHWKAEGALEYSNLVFVPSNRPFDLFDPGRKQHGMRLFVKRVFISEEAEDLVPPWLRFLRGVVDSEDLPLNVSREILQNNPMLARMRKAIVKRVLGELGKKASKKPDEFETFWENFGAVLKEGLYEDPENREAILKVARFHSTAGDELTSLADYASRMKEGQEAIYYVSGEDREKARLSPQLEGFVAKGVEVLLATDPVDEFWIPAVGEYEGKAFKSVTRGGADLDGIGTADEKPGRRRTARRQQDQRLDRHVPTDPEGRSEGRADLGAAYRQRRLPGIRRGRPRHTHRTHAQA